MKKLIFILLFILIFLKGFSQIKISVLPRAGTDTPDSSLLIIDQGNGTYITKSISIETLSKIIGTSGPTGATGPTGSTGLVGATGVTGATGSAAGIAWGLTGNTGTTSGINFIGTTDNNSLVFRTNNNKVAGIDSLGNFWVQGTQYYPTNNKNAFLSVLQGDPFNANPTLCNNYLLLNAWNTLDTLSYNTKGGIIIQDISQHGLPEHADIKTGIVYQNGWMMFNSNCDLSANNEGKRLDQGGSVHPAALFEFGGGEGQNFELGNDNPGFASKNGGYLSMTKR